MLPRKVFAYSANLFMVYWAGHFSACLNSCCKSDPFQKHCFKDKSCTTCCQFSRVSHCLWGFMLTLSEAFAWVTWIIYPGFSLGVTCKCLIPRGPCSALFIQLPTSPPSSASTVHDNRQSHCVYEITWSNFSLLYMSVSFGKYKRTHNTKKTILAL